jgi:hypothetical protein
LNGSLRLASELEPNSTARRAVDTPSIGLPFEQKQPIPRATPHTSDGSRPGNEPAALVKNLDPDQLGLQAREQLYARRGMDLCVNHGICDQLGYEQPKRLQGLLVHAMLVAKCRHGGTRSSRRLAVLLKDELQHRLL